MDSPVTGVAVYLIIWWIVIFMVLPIGVRQPTSEELEPGQERGAPAKPMMWRKLLATTVISALIWVAVYLIEQSGVISFR